MYIWVEHSPHYSWCDVWDVSGTSSFKRSERSKKHQLLFIAARGKGGGAKLILLLLLLLSELTVPASLSHIHTQTYFFHSLSFFPSSLPSLPHTPPSLSLSLSRAHSLSHAHTAWPLNKHISLVLTKAHFSTHLRFRDDRKHVSSRHTHTQISNHRRTGGVSFGVRQTVSEICWNVSLEEFYRSVYLRISNN